MPPAARTARDDLIRQLLPRVRVIANWHIRRARIRESHADDIYSAGLEGLVRGVDRYDPRHGEPKPYVERRIDGEIRDYLRSLDHLTRHYRNMAKATGVEAWTAPVSLDAEIRSTSGDNKPVPLAATISEPRAEDPEAAASRRSTLALVESAARALPERTRDILRRYYTDEFDMGSIAGELAITESRVCQLIHEAHGHIREALGLGPAVRRARPRARRRPMSSEERSDRRDQRQCSACGEPGHRADNPRHRSRQAV